MDYIVFDEDFYKKMKQHYEAKGVKCKSTKNFSDLKNAKSAVFTLKPHKKPFVINKK